MKKAFANKMKKAFILKLLKTSKNEDKILVAGG